MAAVVEFAISFGNADQGIGFRGFLLNGFCDREGIGEDGFGLGVVVELEISFGNAAQGRGFGSGISIGLGNL